MERILEILRKICYLLFCAASIYALILVLIILIIERFFGYKSAVMRWFEKKLEQNKYLLIITAFFMGILLIWLVMVYIGFFRWASSI